MTRQRPLLWSLVLFLILGNDARAATSGSWRYLDFSGFGGYSKPKISGAETPTVYQFGIGLTGAYRLGSWFHLGASSDYRSINQYSAVTTSGNWRGTRWNMISPTAVIRWGTLLLKADYQFLGNYRLSQQNTLKKDVYYSGPSGLRLASLLGITRRLYLGVYYETVGFSTQHVVAASGADTATKLTSKLNLWQAGAMASLVF